MKSHHFSGSIPLLICILSVATCASQPAPFGRIYVPDGENSFLYIEFCGSRYNKRYQRHEQIISAVKLPVALIEKFPHLKNNGRYSPKNQKIMLKQQAFLKQHGGEKITVWINENKFRKYYPGGLQKGTIIESSDFNQWDFWEMPPLPVPPDRRNWGPQPGRFFNRFPVILLQG